MRILIVDDDFFSRSLLSDMLAPYGKYDIAVNGREAIMAVCKALEDNNPYDLICLDIMMPKMDGKEALEEIRKLEEEKQDDFRSKVIMISAISEAKTIFSSFKNCEAYLVKPFKEEKLAETIKELGLLGE